MYVYIFIHIYTHMYNIHTSIYALNIKQVMYIHNTTLIWIILYTYYMTFTIKIQMQWPNVTWN